MQKPYIVTATLTRETLRELRQNSWPTLIPAEPSDALLATLGRARIRPTERPAGDVVTELDPIQGADGLWYQAWESRAYTDAERAAQQQNLAESRLQQIAERRWQQETAGIVWNGRGIATDRESRSLIDQELAAIDRGWRLDGEGWKCLDLAGGVRTFWLASNAELADMATAVRLYVKACFAREAELSAAVAAGTYIDAMLAEGWPQSLADVLAA